MWGLFKKKRVNKKPKNLSIRQNDVLRAIYKLQPCNYREISIYLRVIDGSVTPRIAELKRKKLVRVQHERKRRDGRTMSYYSVTAKGLKGLRDVA